MEIVETVRQCLLHASHPWSRYPPISTSIHPQRAMRTILNLHAESGLRKIGASPLRIEVSRLWRELRVRGKRGTGARTIPRIAFRRVCPRRPHRGSLSRVRPPVWNASEALACDWADRTGGVRSTLCAGGSKAARLPPGSAESESVRSFLGSSLRGGLDGDGDCGSVAWSMGVARLKRESKGAIDGESLAPVLQSSIVAVF
jgi:hypothetical protein